MPSLPPLMRALNPENLLAPLQELTVQRGSHAAGLPGTPTAAGGAEGCWA